MTTRRKAQPGTVSHGTMRTEDLIPSFLSVAESHRLSRADRARVRKIQATMKEHEERDTFESYWTSEEAEYDLEALFDILETIAPARHYFGAHPGDGADYGFWEVEQ